MEHDSRCPALSYPPQPPCQCELIRISYEDGYANGLDAAWEAVKSTGYYLEPYEGLKEGYNIGRETALAVIDFLRGES